MGFVLQGISTTDAAYSLLGSIQVFEAFLAPSFIVNPLLVCNSFDYGFRSYHRVMHTVLSNISRDSKNIAVVSAKPLFFA